MASPIIEVRNLSKVYRLGEIGATSLREEAERKWRRLRGKEPKEPEGDFWALKDVSFDVAPGEVLGIIGKNGAGKSTLLKILSRITEPSSGEIRLRGRVAALLEVGTGFHQELTGRENIYLNGTILGMKKREIDAKLDEIIDFSGIEKHIDTPVKRYSSGMNVRLGFAVAAHLEPEILIVDEVLAVGDAEFQKKCIGKMRDVAGHGRTVIFVSHNMAAVERLCGDVIVLRGGSISGRDKPTNAISEYLRSDLMSRELGSQFGAKLFRENGQAANQFLYSDNIKIVLEIPESIRKINNVRFVTRVLRSDGVCVLSSIVPSAVVERAYGTVQTQLPGKLLNLGNYDLVLYIDVPNERVVEDDRSLLTFSIISSDDYDARNRASSLSGVLHPMLDWSKC